MKKNILFAAVSILLTSCLHRSDIKTENGVVEEKIFSPPIKASVRGYNYSSRNQNPYNFSTIDKPEQFLIVFSCEHGTVFTIDRKDLYHNLKKGDKVIIKYHDLLDSDNHPRDYDFIDAQKSILGTW